MPHYNFRGLSRKIVRITKKTTSKLIKPISVKLPKGEGQVQIGLGLKRLFRDATPISKLQSHPSSLRDIRKLKTKPKEITSNLKLAKFRKVKRLVGKPMLISKRQVGNTMIRVTRQVEEQIMSFERRPKRKVVKRRPKRKVVKRKVKRGEIRGFGKSKRKVRKGNSSHLI